MQAANNAKFDAILSLLGANVKKGEKVTKTKCPTIENLRKDDPEKDGDGCFDEAIPSYDRLPMAVAPKQSISTPQPGNAGSSGTKQQTLTVNQPLTTQTMLGQTLITSSEHKAQS